MVRKRHEEGSEEPVRVNAWGNDGISAVQDISLQNEPVVPRVVEPPPAIEPSSDVRPDKTGKVAALIATCALVAGIVGITIMMISVRDLVPIKIVNVTESVDATDGCHWELTIQLQNNSDDPISVNRIAAVIDRGMRGSTMQDAPTLAPGDIGTHVTSFRLPPSETCPATDEINHGNLIFHLNDGSSESLRF